MDNEAFEERAAILEYEAGLPRRAAESAARQAQRKQPTPKPPPQVAEAKQTPGYKGFKEAWESRTRKHF